MLDNQLHHTALLMTRLLLRSAPHTKRHTAQHMVRTGASLSLLFSSGGAGIHHVVAAVHARVVWRAFKQSQAPARQKTVLFSAAQGSTKPKQTQTPPQTQQHNKVERERRTGGGTPRASGACCARKGGWALTVSG